MTDKNRVLNVRDLTLFTVSGIIVLDQLASSAAIGPSAIGWWLVTLVFFSIPYAAITSELGTAWPAQGGIYVWIREAFGPRWGARATWYYWANLTIWIPSVAILAASMFSQLFYPDLSMIKQVGVALVFVLTVGVFGVLQTDVGKWLPNVGALLKVLIMLVIGGAGLALVLAGETRTAFTFETMKPSYDGAIAFLPIIVFNLMGFELMSSAGEEIQDPGKNIPRAILVSVLVIGSLYIFATFGMLAALPSSEIGLDTGLIEALKTTFAAQPYGRAIIVGLGVAVIFTLFTNMVTWAMAANRSIQQAAWDHEVPSVFGHESRSLQTPVAANALMTLVSSVVMIIYFFMATSVEDLFWTLLAFSSLIFFVPYLLMFAGFVVLRLTQPETVRPFRVWGGLPGAIAAAGLGLAFVLQAMVLFVYVPGQPVDWTYVLSILGGCLAAVIIGEVLTRKSI